MLGFIWDLTLCTLAGLLLATVFISPAGALAGAAQGFFVGTFVACGKWQAQRRQRARQLPGNTLFWRF